MSVREDGSDALTPRRVIAQRRTRLGKLGRKPTLDVNDVNAIASRALAECKDGVATKKWRREINALDRSAVFSQEALCHFQDLQARLGLSTTRPILLPLDNQPFWHRTEQRFANYQSSENLPTVVDVAIIGAGLTGAAAAYRLKDAELKVLLIDQGDPAGEASGRNGGNFELLPENSVGTYEGLAPGRFKFMKVRYPHVPVEVLQAVSERQASLVLGLALRNRDLLKETIFKEAISCDFSPKGWLHIAASEIEEQGICDEVSLRRPTWPADLNMVAGKNSRGVRDRGFIPRAIYPRRRNLPPIQVCLWPAQ